MASSLNGHVDVVQALLQHGANVNAAANDVCERERERERERETKR
jgi:ankyrin repeat protein